MATTCTVCSFASYNMAGEQKMSATVSQNDNWNRDYINGIICVIDDFQLFRDALMKCKPESTLDFTVPASIFLEADTLTILFDGEELSETTANLIASMLTFLDEACIEPFDFRLKILLVIRDHAVTSHLWHTIKYLRCDVTNTQLLHCLVQLVPTTCLHCILEEVLELFEYKFKTFDSFVIATTAIQNYKLTLPESGLHDAGKYCRLLLCSDNNKPCVVVDASCSRRGKNELMDKIYIFITECLDIPEHDASLLQGFFNKENL